MFKDRIEVQEKRKEVVVFCSRHPQNVKLGSRRSRAVTAKECTNKACCTCSARAELLFFQSKPIAILPFSLPSPSSLLKLPSR